MGRRGTGGGEAERGMEEGGRGQGKDGEKARKAAAAAWSVGLGGAGGRREGK